MNQYKLLNISDREMIFFLNAKRFSITMIANLIGRNKSTVSRELTRNTSKNSLYSPTKAQERAIKQQALGGIKRKISNSETREMIRK